jgi:hypothetical protein
MGKQTGKRALERPSYRLEDNNNIDLREIRWSYMDWIHMVQDRDQWNLRVPYNFVKF